MLPVGAVFEPFLGRKAFAVDWDVSGNEVSDSGFVVFVKMSPGSWVGKEFLDYTSAR